jgi:hemin uptake protein HemP
MMHANTPLADPAARLACTDCVPANEKPSEPTPSAELFKGAKSVLIEHNGALYRLQSTKLGKLILTK